MKRNSKLFISFILIFTLLFSSVISVNATVFPSYGDVFKDGRITIADATQISKYLAELVELSDEELSVADYNGDGIVNITDATDIQKMLAGLSYKYTHELCDVEYSDFSAEGLTAIPFTVDKNVNADPYNSKTSSYYYFKENSQLANLFTTYNEYCRFFDEPFDEYNEEFFEENSIIFLYRYYTSGSIYFTVDNTYVADNILYLTTTTMHPENGIYTDNIANRNQFIVVNKSDVENIEKICINDSTAYYSY